MNYSHFDQLLGKRTTKKLANNTYAIRRDENISIRLHATDIITYFPGGGFQLNSGGYQTATTKERINRFSPIRITQKDFTWYLPGGELFRDGLTITHLT